MSSDRSRSEGNLQGDHLQPVVQVVAEPIPPRRRVRGRRWSRRRAGCLDLDVVGAADPHELALLEHPQQLDLHLERQLADLVEKQRTAVGQLELAELAAGGAGERAAFVTEQLGFEDLGRNRRAVDRQEALLAAVGVLVDRVGNQLLAGTGLTDDQHVRPRRRDQLHLTEQLFHRLGATDDLAELLVEPCLQLVDPFGEGVFFDQPRDPLP